MEGIETQREFEDGERILEEVKVGFLLAVYALDGVGVCWDAVYSCPATCAI